MKCKTSINVYLISRSTLVIESLTTAFEGDEEIHLRGSSSQAEAAYDALVEGGIDLILIDAAEHEKWALETVSRLAEEDPCCKLLPFGITTESNAVMLLEAGASGYSMRSDSLATARGTMHAVINGTPPCTPRITALIHARIVELSRRTTAGDSAPSGDADLSRREREVLGLLAHGRRNKEIAGDLGIALSTAGKHVQRILSKLEVNRRRDAIRRAYESGILDGAPPFVAA